MINFVQAVPAPRWMVTHKVVHRGILERYNCKNNRPHSHKKVVWRLCIPLLFISC